MACKTVYLTGGRKRAVRDQGQTSSKFPFLKVLASSCFRKSCKSPLPTPTQLFNPQLRRDCEGAVGSALLRCPAHRTHSAAAEQNSAVWISSVPLNPHVLYARPAQGSLQQHYKRQAHWAPREHLSPGKVSHLLTHLFYPPLIYTSVFTQWKYPKCKQSTKHFLSFPPPGIAVEVAITLPQ